MQYDTPSNFESWLGDILGQDQYQVRRLIKDPTGLHFLMAWSLFESKCCQGEFKAARHCNADALPHADSEERALLQSAGKFLHTRYQNETGRNSLAPSSVTNRKALDEFLRSLKKPVEALLDSEIIVLCVFVAARVRNNMFHGQKGIDDWLRDRDLIQTCTTILQVLVSAAERGRPTLTSCDTNAA